MAQARSKKVQSVYSARRRRFLKEIRPDALDYFLISTPENVRYLSGFRGEDSYLLLHNCKWTLISDSRFTEQISRDCPDIGCHIRTGAMLDAIMECLGGKKVFTGSNSGKTKNFAVESASLSIGQYEKLARLVGKSRICAKTSPATSLRSVKDEAETETIKKSAAIAQKAFKKLLSAGSKAFMGRTEADIAGELEYFMRQGGAEAASFPTIVACGENSALPHHKPSKRRVKNGDAVLIDWGAVYGGYCSDLTRVIFIGTIPPKFVDMYSLVLRSQRAAVKVLKSGLSIKCADAAARDIISEAGFGDNFGHGLGHGIGLEIHEGPAVSYRSEGKLVAGNVITVEPGVYLPGIGGVRIEDDLLITPRGATELTSLARSLSSAVVK